MNFFAHFLLDHNPTTPVYNAALIAPDIIRSFSPDNKRYNWENIHNQPNISTLLQEFSSGCLQHIQRDKYFHDSPMFHEIYQNCRQDWRQISQEIELERFWFSLHVTVEMIIDKIFISNNLEKLNEFYFTMSSHETSYMNILQELHFPNLEIFQNRYQRFCESQYLFHYQQPEKIAYALHRIHHSLGIPTPWHEHNIPAVTQLIQHTEAIILQHPDFQKNYSRFIK